MNNLTKKEWNGGVFVFAYSNTEIVVYEEALLYPAASFMAEVGGVLGMFLGFSLLGLWDLIASGFHIMYNKNIH